jgi:hypothetical protein
VDIRLLDQWAFVELPRLNNRVLAGHCSVNELIEALNGTLAQFPHHENISEAQARQLLVHLGIWGTSVTRHHQEAYPGEARLRPDSGLSLLFVGSSRTPFREYFRELVKLSGTGHPERDAYASLVRWNTPKVRTYWKDRQIAELGSEFDDGRIRTYTNTIGEQLILELFKKCETLEKAANDSLILLYEADAVTASNDGLEKLRIAAVMLAGVRRVLRDFFAGDHRGRLTEAHFLDVFRQFAIHWDPDDIAPSGTQDIEFLKRDFILGISVPGYGEKIRRFYPGLLAEECEELEVAMRRPALPTAFLDSVGLSPSRLNIMSKSELAQTLRIHPALAGLYYVLRANARVSSVHLSLAKNYLFKPMRRRNSEGFMDKAVVSNNYGINGHAETALERLVEGRKEHPLRRLGEFSDQEILDLTGVHPDPTLSTEQTNRLLRPSCACPVDQVTRRDRFPEPSNAVE